MHPFLFPAVVLDFDFYSSAYLLFFKASWPITGQDMEHGFNMLNTCRKPRPQGVRRNPESAQQLVDHRDR
jgi:hypothetical protein